MPVEGLPDNAHLLAHPADPGFRLPHRGHRQLHLGRCHLNGPATLACAEEAIDRPTMPLFDADGHPCARGGESLHPALGDHLALELCERREDPEDQRAGRGEPEKGPRGRPRYLAGEVDLALGGGGK